MMQIPDDFDPTMPIRKAMERHGVAKMTVIRWRKRCTGQSVQQRATWSDHEIYLLRTNFHAMTYAQLAEILPGRSAVAIKGRASAMGLKKAPGNFARDRVARFEGQRPKGTADMAAQHLRRDAPVFRCKADGSADPKGKCWRYGNTVLTEQEMIAKAERKGWDADEWRRVGQTAIGAAASNVLSRMQVADD